MPKFTVLCRIDAFADYHAAVEAPDADQAARIAEERHGDFNGQHRHTEEFDARLYVTLDARGRGIDRTQVGDFPNPR